MRWIGYPILILIMTMISQGIEAQVLSARRTVFNERYFTLDNACLSGIYSDTLRMIVDTSMNLPSCKYPNRLENAGYDYLRTGSKEKSTVVLIDKESRKSFQVGNGDIVESYCLPACFICVYNNDVRPYCYITVFDFATQSTSRLCLRGDIVGHSDSCIFMEIGEFRFRYRGHRYEYGSIVSINERGLKLVEPASEELRGISNAYIFYSVDYKVIQHFDSVMHGRHTCIRRIEVFYYDSLIDSVIYISSPFTGVSLRSDFIHFGDTMLFIDDNRNIRTYVSGDIGYLWSWAEWQEVIPSLACNHHPRETYTSGSLLLIKTPCDCHHAENLPVYNNQTYTYNGVVLQPDCDIFMVVAAFDMSTNTFLGYPQIEFRNGQQ